MRWPFKRAAEQPQKSLYVVCAVTQDPDGWIVFKPKDNLENISDEQVYATVKKARGFKPYTFNYARVVGAEDSQDARGKAIGMGLEYQLPNVVLHKKGMMKAEQIRGPIQIDPVQEGMRRAQAEDLAAARRVFGYTR